MILLRPEWLWIAALLAAVALWLRLRPVGGSWDRLMANHLLTFLTDDRGADRNLINRYLLIAAGLCIALSGPAIPDQQTEGYRQLESWVIALDLSASMDANDVQPTRLVAAREQLLTIAERAAARPVSVVGFAGDAYLLTPFSTQLTQLKKLLPTLSTDVFDIEGSRISRALSLAANLLRDNQVPNGRLILMTDATEVTDAAIDIADRLRRAGQTLDVIVVATASGGRVSEQNSPLLVPDMDNAARLADAGGGQLLSTDRLGRLPGEYLRSLDSRLLPDQLGLLSVQPVGWTDMSHWLLLLLGVPMLCLFRQPVL